MATIKITLLFGKIHILHQSLHIRRLKDEHAGANHGQGNDCNNRFMGIAVNYRGPTSQVIRHHILFLLL